MHHDGVVVAVRRISPYFFIDLIDQIYEKVWGYPSYGDNNTVMVHIRKLREKIEKDPSNPSYIVTVRGLGYRFIPDQGEKGTRS